MTAGVLLVKQCCAGNTTNPCRFGMMMRACLGACVPHMTWISSAHATHVPIPVLRSTLLDHPVLYATPDARQRRATILVRNEFPKFLN